MKFTIDQRKRVLHYRDVLKYDYPKIAKLMLLSNTNVRKLYQNAQYHKSKKITLRAKVQSLTYAIEKIDKQEYSKYDKDGLLRIIKLKDTRIKKMLETIMSLRTNLNYYENKNILTTSNKLESELYFYKNMCKRYEYEIENLRNVLRKLNIDTTPLDKELTAFLTENDLHN